MAVFISSFIDDHFAWYCCLLFPALFAWLLCRDNLPPVVSLWSKRAETAIAYAGGVAVAVAIFFISLFKFPYTYENKYDFNAVYYSVVQVYNGIPMLVNHFTNTYGLYPHFVVPIMKLFGLSILSFSAVMAFLCGLCFIFMLLFLGRIINHKLLILLGIAAVFYNCYIYSRVRMGLDAYYAMTPIRWILPCSLLFYAACYLKHRSRLLYGASFFLYGLGILWCPDFGVLTFLSLIAFYAFLEFEAASFVAIVKRIALHGLAAVVGLAAAFAAFAACIRIFYRAFPDFGLLFSTMKVFSIVGMGMLPMPATFHPWMPVALIYLTGILLSVRSIATRSVTPRSAMVFLLTAIGVVSFQYYLGRSHNWNLFSSGPWCFMLLTVYADDALTVVKSRRVFLLPLAVLLFALSFSVFQVAGDAGGIAGLMFETAAKEKNKNEQAFIEMNAESIRSATHEKEPVMIFSANYYQGLYYGLSHTAAALNPGMEDLFLRSDYERILSFIAENTAVKIFYDAGSFRCVRPEIPILLSSLYDVRSGDGSRGTILFLTKKPESAGSGFLFAQDTASYIHEEFDNNPAARVHYAEGYGSSLSLGTRFSIQVLFRPAVLPPPLAGMWQTVFNNRENLTDASGCSLQRTDRSPGAYTFSIGGNSIDCPVETGAWNYLAYEVNDQRLRIFKNGRLMGVLTMPSTYRNSGQPLYVGNFNAQGAMFWGDIREIAITGSLLDEKVVAATWKKTAEML